MSVYLVYLFSCMLYEGEYRHSSQYAISQSVHIDSKNPLGVVGIDADNKDPILFWIVVSLTGISIITWLKLVLFQGNPGMVNSRFRHYEEVVTLILDILACLTLIYQVLAQSLHAQGPPLQNIYCKTTLVKKPLRSKYCTRMGYVVARMDHYCIWLNLTIGYNNHRTFIIFLFSHLFTAVTSAIMMIR